MYRSITMRIEPNGAQRAFIDESMRVHHYVYNALKTAVRLHFEKHRRFPSQNTLNRICTRLWQNNGWMHRIYQNTLNQAAKRILDAFKACNPELEKCSRGGQAQQRLRSPRFKKLDRSNTFGYLSNRTFKIVEADGKRRLSLGKMPGTLRCYNQSTPIKGVPKTVVISRRLIGGHYEYSATIQYE